MIGNEEMTSVVGRTAYSIDGEKIGTVGQLYLDDTTNQPEFVTVNTGLLGMSESFVPVVNASVDGDRLVVPFSKDKVKDAPSVEASDQHLDSDEERRLFDYYGMDYGTPSGLGWTPAGWTPVRSPTCKRPGTTRRARPPTTR